MEVWLHAFLTSALDGSEWKIYVLAAVPIRKESPVSIG
jgi:hypothetical protein